MLFDCSMADLSVPSPDWCWSTGIVSLQRAKERKKKGRKKEDLVQLGDASCMVAATCLATPSTVPLIFGTRDQGRSVNRFSLYFTPSSLRAV